MARYKYLYRYSVDRGQSWTDLSSIVNSSMTTIVPSLCTADFKSARDKATFEIPAVPSEVKQRFINALISDLSILIEIKDGDEVVFTGYVDRDETSLRSYPYTANVSVSVCDVSILHLDDKVNRHIFLENKTITQIVHELLSYAGYAYDSSAIATSEERTIAAFVIDKDNCDTYRSYIDTLLLEAGGYVLDFKADGIASIARISWDDASGYSLVDNPVVADGITTRTKILKEDGVSLKWSTLKWTPDANQTIWQDSISRKIDSNLIVGEDVEKGRYWPDGGEINPVYMEYDSSLLDKAYLTRETRKQNEDLSIIAVKDVTAEIQATKNRQAFNAWQYPIIQEFVDDHGLTSNPMAWPKKAWYLLRNNTNETVNIQHFRLHGKVLYRDQIHTLKILDSKNPKEYVSKYIYTQEHAQHFINFYWHFMKHSRNVVSWKEIDSERHLGDVVRVSHKGSFSTIDAVIAGMTITYIGKVKVTAFSAVGIDSQVVNYETISSGVANSGATDARGIVSIVSEYATSASQTGEKSAYGPDLPILDATTKKVLWQKQTTTYTDGTQTVTEAIIGTYGDTGSVGWSQATVTLYKRSKDDQYIFDGGRLTYQFSTGGLTGDLGSWSRTVPKGDEKLWMITASAFAQSTSDYIETSDWTTPAVLSENGTVGQDGFTVLTVILYQRKSTAPSKPTTTATYNFTTNTITGVGSWSLSVPSGTDPVWVTSATASTRNTVEDNIEPSEWSTVQMLVQNGSNGKNGDYTEYEYAIGTSLTTAPTSGWSSTMPTRALADGEYIWQRSRRITY